MTNTKLIFWLMILIIGLPLFSETVYTPSLSAISEDLEVPNSWVEYTLTIYLFGFALGVMFWGRLSDLMGRKPAILCGYLIYILGCLGCWISTSIEMLLFFRFIQALGGSTGSVVGQTICRDAFSEKERGKVYSTMSIALSVGPMLGPVFGGYITELFGWSSVFLFLTLTGSLVMIISHIKLPETRSLEQKNKKPPAIVRSIITILGDTRVLAYGAIVGIGNGIVFSFSAESPFIFIETWGMDTSDFGLTFLCYGLVFILASLTSRLMLGRGLPPIKIMYSGAALLFISSVALSFLMGFYNISSGVWAIPLSIIFISTMYYGIGLMIPNALSAALKDYGHMVGTASSCFGFFYYSVISLLTALMGLLHTGEAVIMPLYFVVLSLILMSVIKGKISKDNGVI